MLQRAVQKQNGNDKTIENTITVVSIRLYIAF